MRDVIIIGGGPAGLSAGIYASRAGLDALLLERLYPGGQIATTSIIENYPGIAPTEGPEFSFAMERQAKSFGLEVRYENVVKLSLEGEVKRVYANEEYEAKAIILALGARPALLGLPKEGKLRGHGISYCAVCDGNFFKGKPVAVVGGGDTAAEDVLYLSKIVPKVYLIHRRDQMRASAILQNKVLSTPNVEPLWNAKVKEIIGEKAVSGVDVEFSDGSERRLDIDALFVAIGYRPNTALVDGQLTLRDGYIVTDEMMRTEIPGVFAAGDVRAKLLKQVVTAAADGALAAYSAQQYINVMK